MLVPTRRPASARRRGRIPRPLVYLLAFVIPPMLVGGLTVRSQLTPPAPPPVIEDALPNPPAHDPTRLTAVIVAGSTGAESIDLLAPYEVLSTSGAFNVYTLAPERRVLPLFPASPHLQGTHFLPHYSFAEFDSAVGVQPDLIVVPWIPAADGPDNAALYSWLRDHATPDTMLLTICGGSWTAAQAGLLDGYAATTHQNVFPVVTRDHPRTTWVTGRRWVHDRNVVSSAGITAGVDATLHVLSELVGRDVAEDVARQVDYPHVDFLDDPRYDVPVPDKRLRLLNLAFRWDRTDIALVLYDGVGEIDVASIVDLHPRTHSNVVTGVGRTDGLVVTRHGLHLVPHSSTDDATDVDRVLLPGQPGADVRRDVEEWAANRGLRAGTVHGDGFAFDAALRDLTAHETPALAGLVATGAEYPADVPLVPRRHWPWELLLRPIALGTGGVLTVATIRLRRQRTQP